MRLHWTVRLIGRWHCWRGRHIVCAQRMASGEDEYEVTWCIRGPCRWEHRRRMAAML